MTLPHLLYIVCIIDISHINVSLYYSAYGLGDIKAKNRHGAAIIHMILNNLDPKVAQFPQELVTYGGNGQVFSNWAQVGLL